MPTGKLKWFNIVKGFGFVVPDDGGADVYIPMTKVEEAKLPHLETGMALQYSIGQGKGRRFAENLSLIEDANQIFASKSESAQPNSGELR